MDKIDLIIAVLQRVKCLFEAHGQYPHTLREVNEALAAANELRELKPVAWSTNSEIDLTPEFFFSWTKSPVHEIPLYALDEVTK